jgi:flavodoxin short chain
MASLIAKGAEGAGAEVTCKNVSSASPEEIDGYGVVVLGSPSMGSEVIEESEMEPFVSEIIPKLSGRKAAVFGSYGWGDGEWMRDWAARMKSAGVDLLDDGLIVHETPEGDSERECVAYGGKIAAF